MLESIKNFFAELLGFFQSIFDFIMDFITDTIYVIRLLGSLPVRGDVFQTLIGWLPHTIIIFIEAIVAIAIIYKILGREG